MEDLIKRLTDKQARALAWIRDYPHDHSGWNADSSAITLAGSDGSLRIAQEDWAAMRGLFEQNAPDYSPGHWRLTPLGLAALRAHAQEG